MGNAVCDVLFLFYFFFNPVFNRTVLFACYEQATFRTQTAASFR